MFKRNKNFTLMELLIVIAIIGLIAAIASPRMNETINDARRARFNGNVASILSAVNLYLAHNNGLSQRTADGTTVASTIFTHSALQTSAVMTGGTTVYPTTNVELLAYLETTALTYNEIDGGTGGFVIGSVYVDPAGTNTTAAGEILRDTAVCNATHVRVFAIPDSDNNTIPGSATDIGANGTGTAPYLTYVVGNSTTTSVLVYDSTTATGLVANVWDGGTPISTVDGVGER